MVPPVPCKLSEMGGALLRRKTCRPLHICRGRSIVQQGDRASWSMAGVRHMEVKASAGTRGAGRPPSSRGTRGCPAYTPPPVGTDRIGLPVPETGSRPPLGGPASSGPGAGHRGSGRGGGHRSGRENFRGLALSALSMVSVRWSFSFLIASRHRRSWARICGMARSTWTQVLS